MNTFLLNQLLSPIASARASHQRCNNSNNHDDDDEESSSHFQTTVCLYDWWLIKADKDVEGKRLAVAGFNSKDFHDRLRAMRVFTSAPIVKIYDTFTLETADGICIVIKGFINKLRTKENGFSAEVFSHFLFGFPTNWEAYNEKCLEDEFTTGADLANDINNSATKHGSIVGMTNANPNTAPINYKVNGKKKQNVEDVIDCPENVSEKVTSNARKSFDWQNHASEDINTDKVKDHATEDLLPSMNCGINAVSLHKDNLTLPAELSNCDVTPERMANSKSCGEGGKGTVQKSKTQEPASLESPIPKVSYIENRNSFNLDPAVPMEDSSLDLRITSKNVNSITATNVHTNTIDVTPSNSRSRKIRNQNKHSEFTGSVWCNSEELMSETAKHIDGENLKRCSLGTISLSGKKIDTLEAARSQSINRMVRNMTNSKRKKMGSASLVSDRTSNLEGMNVFDYSHAELQQPTHDTVIKNNSKQGKDHRKESQAGTPRQKTNYSDGSRNEFDDTNHRCESEAAVGERTATDKGHSSKKKAQRKIDFDTQARPVTRGRKENVVSPEFLSLKRSRSGRLLLPSLDFWRNQIAVYDRDRKITGIQVATPSKGSQSEPPKKWRQ